MRRDYRFDDHEVTFTILADRDRWGPWGLFGGRDGRKAYYILDPDGEARELGSKTTVDLMPGDVVEKFGENFGIHYPDYQMKTGRGVKRFPVHDAYAAAGAVWASDQGWELPAWFAPQGVEPIDRYSYRRAN